MFFRTTSSAIALVALASPVFADVTPTQVWDAWVDYYEASGYKVTEGSREEAGETLSLKGVVLSLAAPEGESLVSINVPDMELTSTGDGKVRTTMAESSDITFEFKDEDDKNVKIAATYSMKDAEIITSGDLGNMTHDSTVGEMIVELKSATTEEGEMPLPVKFRAEDLKTVQTIVDGDIINVDMTASAGKMDATGDLQGLGENKEGKFAFNMVFDNYDTAGKFSMPKGVNWEDPEASLAAIAKVAFDGKATVGAGSFDFSIYDKDDTDGTVTDLKGKVEFGGFDIAALFTKAGLSYQGSSDKIAVEFASSDLPFPVNYGMDQASFDVQMPLAKSEEAQPFKLAYSIGGLTIGDQIWDLFDAGKKLPRDPASLDVDVTGLVKIAVDIFDPKAMEIDTTGDVDADGDMAALDDLDVEEPFVPVELTINKFAIDAAGAKVDASGALTFPEDGLVEEPIGKVTTKIEGANGLIDKLVEMGLIPQDQSAGIRMMLAMFAKPTSEGADSLISEMEFKEGGQVFANGQQVK